ncbi:MAG: 3-deoxy-7-phosphoheptulonate synthase [Gammaproteobacteria bacterium]|nr:3-deoxy-7-phosphoheptulonate synthase [Gammaproteobacteria bacterium]
MTAPVLPPYRTEDLRIASIDAVSTPAEVHADFPGSIAAQRTTFETRQAIRAILSGEDDRLLVVAGPCSIHDVDAAREYGRRLVLQRQALADALLVVMRVYFEKPRTTVGWKGLINDPDLDETFRINKGLCLARHLLLDLNEMGVPAATEYLDLITPQYVNDLISWGAIGARTTESQVHRELASGLSCPVGFKNGTDGNVRIAIDAMRSASQPHRFLSYTKTGHSAIFATRGNDDTHIILRGGRKPNYDSASVDDACHQLRKAGLRQRIMIDFSHANSGKDPLRQALVAEDVGGQIAAGERRVIGAMIESHLVGGRQDVVPGEPLVFGQSITDACLAWDETVPVLETLAAAVTPASGAPSRWPRIPAFAGMTR